MSDTPSPNPTDANRAPDAPSSPEAHGVTPWASPEPETDRPFTRSHAAATDARQSAATRYRQLVTGGGWPTFIKYELLTTCLGDLPGAAGLALRAKAYRHLLADLGPGSVIGRDVTLRRPDRIRIGRNCIIEDHVVLDAKGDQGDGIIIRDNVFLGRGTILSLRGGTIDIGPGTCISSNCRMGTLGTIRIGEKALVAAYTYLAGAGHRTDNPDITIADAPIDDRGGITVGDGAWLGAYTMLMDGITVGEHAVVGAHSVVRDNIPPYAVAAGAPAQFKKDRRAQPPSQ
ncbi:hypothetical protein ACERK3_02045 [Phycisphaerales bacterium AB-hyl4]|uniref:Acyltransferase n=1 Tax=Natronomicrosphaera hydrolytica TaxID=3242702 RepID=A0ABV4U120_9BACT